MPFNTISVVGLGYVGLPTAAVLASLRKKVIGVEINQHTVDTINRGENHILEPELSMLVHAGVKEGYLRATTTPESADAFLIAVPTPFKGDHEPDLSYIKVAAKAIATVLEKDNLVILESTVPVGATEKTADWLAEARPDLSFPHTHGEQSDIRVAHCPERVLPGYVIRELAENARVIGGLTPKCSEVAASLYKIFVEAECVITNARTAEMAKLAENSFRDVNIAFANELSIICNKLDIDVWELIELANRHPRVNILQPGCGVGGHCIAVDPWFIVNKTPGKAKLIKQARSVNDQKPEWVIEKINKEIDSLVSTGKDKSSITIALLGLAFKPNIDDSRESPALHVAKRIVSGSSSSILIVEPNITELPSGLANANKVELDEALAKADVLVVLVAHDQFKGVSCKLNEAQRAVFAVNI